LKKSNFTKGRFGGRLIEFISNYSEKYPNLTKKEVLRKSINDTMNLLMMSLKIFQNFDTMMK
jgi:hypothetical protein